MKLRIIFRNVVRLLWMAYKGILFPCRELATEATHTHTRTRVWTSGITGIDFRDGYNYYVFGHYPSSCRYLRNTVLLIFQNTTFRRLDSVFVFRYNLLSWAVSVFRYNLLSWAVSVFSYNLLSWAVSVFRYNLLNWASRFFPEDGDRIQSPKRCVLKNKQDGVF
jgi:hypothetical protein